MEIYEVINQLIKTFNYKSYCEIGYLQGYTHTQINCHFKIAVDPTPQRSRQDMLNRGDNVIIKTSDAFFADNEIKFDIFFIDGCHQASYVYRDIMNGMKFLNDNGCLVLHDVCPYFESWSRSDQCGDGYKAFMKCRCENPDMKMYVIDYFDKVENQGPPMSDSSGWGIVFKGKQELWNKPVEYTWNFMNANRIKLMNITPLETIIQENNNAN